MKESEGGGTGRYMAPRGGKGGMGQYVVVGAGKAWFGKKISLPSTLGTVAGIALWATGYMYVLSWTCAYLFTEQCGPDHVGTLQ